jgi:protein-disulfide isomerase
MKKRTWFILVFIFALILLAAACGPVGDGPRLVSEVPALSGSTELAEVEVEAAVDTAPESNPALNDPFEAAANLTTGEIIYDANGIEVGFTEDGHPYRGSRSAPIVLEEFSDYQCPFCARYFSDTLPSLMQNQVAGGQVMTIFYDFPLTAIHPQAAAAAHAVRCAGDQGAAAYWDMHDKIFASPDEWSNNQADAIFKSYAETLGLDTTQFDNCQSEGKHETHIQEDLNLGRSRGVGSTPSFFVNNQILVGAQPLSVFTEAFAIITEGGALPVAETEPEAPTVITGSPLIDPVSAVIVLDDAAFSLGDPDAPVTIVEYTDYQCPYCQRYAQETLPQIVSEMVENGRVYYVVKDFPLDSIHPYARDGAAAARCAGDQGAYWDMHDVIFDKQAEWINENAAQVLAGFAADLGLDVDAYNQCVSNGRYTAAIQANLDEGARLGVSGTPAFFINGFLFSGALPFETFAANVALAETGELAAMFTPHSIGSPDAPVTIVEYTDFECPYCYRYFIETYPQIKENYIDTGLVRYVFKDLPLTSIHPRAGAAAFAARCAGDQGVFIGMHDTLFTQQAEWAAAQDIDSLLAFFNGYAEELGMDTAVFTDCLLTGNHQSAIMADLQEAVGFGIQGTPAFFINDTFLSGAQPYAEFERIIEASLGN